MAPVRFGYLSREYADRHMGAFRVSKPPQLERVSLAPHQGNHCFALIGKRADIMKWLSEEHPDMLLEVTETLSWKKDTTYSGVIKVTVQSVHVGLRFFYLMFGKKLTSKLLVEFSPWDGKSKPGEPMPLDRDDIDDIPLSGESILIRSNSTMTQVAEKLRTKRKVMDEAGGVKVMGLRLERASTFSSVHRTKSQHSVPDSPTAEDKGSKNRRFSSFSFSKRFSGANAAAA
ncbi:hypothetical protein BC939DRAFT_508595 [Gamsiella multidivaricata]|uniref:uncharacterized protein n=1 Tax=Gamsiella multidivaricata TaxID=101098 RepID=UPI0022210563|nr:uncharacterized protein BC939DRAFT_508595 [Gamsiella multidivaricata]KAG0365051.1 hypothetical protein BGZ54_006920 [Gamsiella multidivaricata]KAI7816151.1 hypothetical protein BC939DRAFT_508595 [Gamsiella multidivaricata]